MTWTHSQKHLTAIFKSYRLFDALKTSIIQMMPEKILRSCHLAVLFRCFLFCLFSFTCSLSMFMYRRRCIRNWDWRCRERRAVCNIWSDRAGLVHVESKLHTRLIVSTCLFSSSWLVRGHRACETRRLDLKSGSGCDLSASHDTGPLTWNTDRTEFYLTIYVLYIFKLTTFSIQMLWKMSGDIL